MKITSSLILPLCTVIIATSCASFPSNRVPKVVATPPASGKKVSLTYSMTAGSNMFGASRIAAQPAMVEQFTKPLLSAADKSGQFSSVTQGNGGNVHLDVDMLNYGNGGVAMASGFICGLSLFTIPGFGADNYKVTATAKNSSGKSRQYVLDDGATSVIWLPMIFVAPFKNPLTVLPGVQENMYSALIEDMKKDGILTRSGN